MTKTCFVQESEEFLAWVRVDANWDYDSLTNQILSHLERSGDKPFEIVPTTLLGTNSFSVLETDPELDPWRRCVAQPVQNADHCFVSDGFSARFAKVGRDVDNQSLWQFVNYIRSQELRRLAK